VGLTQAKLIDPIDINKKIVRLNKLKDDYWEMFTKFDHTKHISGPF